MCVGYSFSYFWPSAFCHFSYICSSGSLKVIYVSVCRFVFLVCSWLVFPCFSFSSYSCIFFLFLCHFFGFLCVVLYSCLYMFWYWFLYFSIIALLVFPFPLFFVHPESIFRSIFALFCVILVYDVGFLD